MKGFIEIPKDRNDLDGKEDFSLVEVVEDRPTCKVHGAMNKVSEEIWRCLAQYGRDDPKPGETIGKFRDRVCNACCLEGGNKCDNCGKLKTNHCNSTEISPEGDWCFPLNKVKPREKEYLMRYEDSSQNTGSGKQ